MQLPLAIDRSLGIGMGIENRVFRSGGRHEGQAKCQGQDMKAPAPGESLRHARRGYPELLGGNAENLDLDVVVHVARGIALAVETDIAALDAADRNKETILGLDVGSVGAGAEGGRVVEVVVENGGHAGGEGRIIRDLNDDIMVGTALGMEMPEPDRLDIGFLLEVDLHPLETIGELNEIAFPGILLAIGHIRNLADDRKVVAAGDGFAFGEEFGAGRDLEFRGLGGSGFQIGNFNLQGCPLDFFGRKCGGQRDGVGGAGGEAEREGG